MYSCVCLFEGVDGSECVLATRRHEGTAERGMNKAYSIYHN